MIGPYVAHVELPHSQIALPADNVERIEGIEDLGNLVVHLDAHFPLALVAEVRVGLGHGHHALVVERVMAEQTLVGRFEFGARLDDQEEIVLRLRHDAVSHGARDH